MEHRRIHSSRPDRQIPESPLLETLLHRSGRDHGAARSPVIPAQVGVGPGDGNGKSSANILRKLGVVGGRKGDRPREAQRSRRMADRAFRGDMDGLRLKLSQPSPDTVSGKDGQPDRGIGRTGIGSKILRCDEGDLMPEILQVIGGMAQRSHHAIDLWMPRVGGYCDSHLLPDSAARCNLSVILNSSL